MFFVFFSISLCALDEYIPWKVHNKIVELVCRIVRILRRFHFPLNLNFKFSTPNSFYLRSITWKGVSWNPLRAIYDYWSGYFLLILYLILSKLWFSIWLWLNWFLALFILFACVYVCFCVFLMLSASQNCWCCFFLLLLISLDWDHWHGCIWPVVTYYQQKQQKHDSISKCANESTI